MGTGTSLHEAAIFDAGGWRRPGKEAWDHSQESEGELQEEILIFTDLKRCAHSDWSRIASYLAMIAQIVSITTGALNLKMAALRFIGVTEEVMNVKKKTEFRRAQKLLLCLEWHFFNRRIRSFCWFNWMNPSDSNGSWLYTSIRVIKTTKTEFFNIKTNIYNRIRKHLGNCTKTIIPRRLGEYCWICCGLVEKYSLRLQRIIC